jgi:Tfp pilus assembly protein PilV
MPKDCVNKRAHRRAGRAGFTLFEVMLAALVLGTALVALVRMLNLGRVSLDADAKRAIALSLLRREAELVRARGYDALATQAAEPLADAPAYSRAITAVYAGGGLKLVTVTITWDSPTKSAVSESVQFVVADNVLPTWTWEEP